MCGLAVFSVMLITAWRLLRFAEGANEPPSPHIPSIFSVADIVTIWLGVLAVMVALASLIVTGVGLVVGVLAIFGFQTFREQVAKQVGDAAGARIDILESKVKKHLTTQRRSENASGLTFTTEPLVIKRYPNKQRKGED